MPCKPSALKEVAAGMVTGIAFVVLLAVIPISAYPGHMDNARFPDIVNYPYLQLQVSGLRGAYASGERIDFHVTQTAGGCAYPESIALINRETGLVIYEFNGTEASSLLFCPIIFDPTDTSMRWSSDDWIEIPIAIREPGQYMVVVKHLYRTIEQPFKVVPGVDYVSIVTMPSGFNEFDAVSFKPRELTVVIGTNNTVRWINNDYYANQLHAVQDDSGIFGSEIESVLLENADSFEYTFDKPGQFEYLGNNSQKGTITVLPEID